MKANEIKFGIEVETHINAAYSNHVGGYHRPRQVEFLPSGWKVGTDSSIQCYSRDGSVRYPSQIGRKDAEFVSPILVGEEGLREAYRSIEKIRDCEWDAKVNKSCGIHVTITFPKNNAAALARLICFFAHHEEGLYATTGSKARRNGRWSKSLKTSAGAARPKDKPKAAENAAKRDRYHSLNLEHLAAGQDRVEFRLFSGSTSPEKIISWVRLVLAIAELCLNTERSVSFNTKQSVSSSQRDSRGAGVGHRRLRILVNRLGWNKSKTYGYSGKEYGNQEIGGLPTVKHMVKTLFKLAKKYDNQ